MRVGKNQILKGWVLIASILITSCFSGTIAWAIPVPIKDFRLLAAPKRELTARVNTASVVIADYDLLKKDFPELKGRSDKEIDGWILHNTAYISLPQFKQTVVNTEIDVDILSTIGAYRPYAYGRALVFPAGEGLIDVKGVGSLSPKQMSHGNGLATVGEGIREYAFEKMVNKVLHHYKTHFNSAIPYDTVGTYAVLDLGFEIKHNTGKTSPAGAILRQAHDRHGSPGDEYYNFLPAEDGLKIELILRKYGITSTGVANSYFDITDIQGTKDLALVDFGTYMVTENFTQDLSVMGEGPEAGLDRSSPNFIQPTEVLRLPMDTWGHDGSKLSRSDKVRTKSERLSRLLRSKELGRDEVQDYVDKALLAPTLNKWKAVDMITVLWMFSKLSTATKPVVNGLEVD